ncbi:hypothetical protein QM467_18215 [Rhodoblastus sp. 17X3]|uniref:hypothetical protein n=1 Tax=Rhodoblastus sp. 17X3 TaxID=3047026 RepID=UPI0024B70158|nr:hypothetical protein [Rhodoblastus sp. 17X3]MDI9849977.1 hypothetical protein [Rhodoblastus sp. 17X3]
MAIWFPMKTQRVGTPSVILHFNLWRLKGKKTGLARLKFWSDQREESQYLLDMGIMVTSPADLAEISIHLPIQITDGDIKDLGPSFADGNLATAVFNESLEATNGPSQSVIILQKAVGGTYCRVLKFPLSRDRIPASHLAISPEFDGTTLTITSAALAAGLIGIAPNEDLYFRLRLTIPKNGANTFVNAAIPDDDFLTSSVDVTEYLDFRLNQARNLNLGIVHKMVGANWPMAVPITRLDFLMAVGVTVDVVVGHPVFHKCRLLEPGKLWESYVNEDHLQKGMAIYHWKQEAKGSYLVDFNAFVKLRMRTSSGRIIGRYLLIALIFGVFVGVLGNSVYDSGKWAWARLFGKSTDMGSPQQTSCPAPAAAKPLETTPAALPPNQIEAPKGSKVEQPALNGAKTEPAQNGTAGTNLGGKVKQ